MAKKENNGTLKFVLVVIGILFISSLGNGEEGQKMGCSRSSGGGSSTPQICEWVSHEPLTSSGLDLVDLEAITGYPCGVAVDSGMTTIQCVNPVVPDFDEGLGLHILDVDELIGTELIGINSSLGCEEILMDNNGEKMFVYKGVQIWLFDSMTWCNDGNQVIMSTNKQDILNNYIDFYYSEVCS